MWSLLISKALQDMLAVIIVQPLLKIYVFILQALPYKYFWHMGEEVQPELHQKYLHYFIYNHKHDINYF